VVLVPDLCCEHCSTPQVTCSRLSGAMLIKEYRIIMPMNVDECKFVCVIVFPIFFPLAPGALISLVPYVIVFPVGPPLAVFSGGR
jgi:hypothetical protein